MGKFCVLLALLLLSCSVGSAQDMPLQIYGGFQYTQIDIHQVQNVFNLDHVENPSTPLVDVDDHMRLSGWNFGGQGDTKWFGFVIDASGNYGIKRIDLGTFAGVDTVARAQVRDYTFMGGPQLTLRRSSRFQPFARALFGGVWHHDMEELLENNVPQSFRAPFAESDQSVALGAGGGLDVFFTRRVGVRVAADYIRTYLFSDTQNNYRATAGLIFRITR